MTEGITPASSSSTGGSPDLAMGGLLRSIIAIASEERELRSVLREVARLVVGATGADACFVHVVDREAAEVVLMGATPEEFDALAGGIRLRIGEGIAGWVAQHGKPAVVDDKWSDPRYRYIPSLRGEDYSSLVSVPLLRPTDAVVGVLNVHAHDPEHFIDDILERLEEVASLLAGIVEGAVLHDRVRRREVELEQFAIRTIELQELDRRRMAGDIHDGISQRLVSAWYHLRAASSLIEDPQAQQEVEATSALLSEALAEARHAITGLRPTVLDDLGLISAITSLAKNLGDLDADLDIVDCGVAPHVETALYRIVQEALQNVVKHAQASQVEILLLSDDGGVLLRVSDDGIGFEPGRAAGPTSYGLAGMHERAGLLGATLHLRSSPGQGTSITVRLPPDAASR